VLARPWTAPDRALAKTASACLVNFAKTGNPNGDALPLWTAADPNRPEILELAGDSKAIPVATAEKLAFWMHALTTAEIAGKLPVF
jgi:para-nitrobenzyl esterase